MKKRKGFTLAEILITLVMIGVVSSLTIPSLINNISDQQNKIAWRKSFADLSQVAMRMTIDNGGSFKDICTDSNCLKDLYLKYLNYTKSCNAGQMFGNCWNNLDSFWYLDGTSTAWGNNAGIILSNSALLDIWYASKDCTYPVGDIRYCANIVIDVNGFKGPNRVGKDIFGIYVLENSVKPWGSQNDGNVGKCENSTGDWSGRGCSALYLYQ